MGAKDGGITSRQREETTREGGTSSKQDVAMKHGQHENTRNSLQRGDRGNNLLRLRCPGLMQSVSRRRLQEPTTQLSGSRLNARANQLPYRLVLLTCSLKAAFYLRKHFARRTHTICSPHVFARESRSGRGQQRLGTRTWFGAGRRPMNATQSDLDCERLSFRPCLPAIPMCERKKVDTSLAIQEAARDASSSCTPNPTVSLEVFAAVCMPAPPLRLPSTSKNASDCKCLTTFASLIRA